MIDKPPGLFNMRIIEYSSVLSGVRFSGNLSRAGALIAMKSPDAGVLHVAGKCRILSVVGAW